MKANYHALGYCDQLTNHINEYTFNGKTYKSAKVMICDIDKCLIALLKQNISLYGEHLMKGMLQSN